jgi:predicted TIM-barrel fold metal-dependent hydrolase
VYEAAQAYDLPVGLHVFGASGHPYTGAGWPSYYVEEGAGHSTSCQTVVTSLVLEGVFERFPKLRVVIIEGGFAWLPALSWRLDKLFERMRDEVPHLKRRPSEYIREHIWVTTQPMEEPQDRAQVLDVMEWVGWDRLLFASDYPHWDFDDPFRAFPPGMPRQRYQQILTANARAVYRLG